MTPEKKQLNVCLQILCILIDVEVESQFSQHCSIKWLMTKCHPRKHVFYKYKSNTPHPTHTHTQKHTRPWKCCKCEDKTLCVTLLSSMYWLLWLSNTGYCACLSGSPFTLVFCLPLAILCETKLCHPSLVNRGALSDNPLRVAARPADTVSTTQVYSALRVLLFVY